MPLPLTLATVLKTLIAVLKLKLAVDHFEVTQAQLLDFHLQTHCLGYLLLYICHR